MTDLLIRPQGYSDDKLFDLKAGNRPRTNKVPMVILNATTLNTGRNWQFTAVNFGEQESGDSEYNKNNLLKATRYDDSMFNRKELHKYKKIPLSIAVAASACVPGIFSPLALTKLYPEVTPLLVDGGVHDNQGISAIIYEGCTDLIISDASGQMDFKPTPGGAFLNVLSRTNSVLMDRVRNHGIRSTAILNRAGIIDKVKIFHLKQDLDIRILKPGHVKFAEEASKSMTEYGILKKIQEYLAHIRTDLDSFTDLEAYSLMFSGYKICSSTIPSTDASFNWKFLCVEDYMGGKPGNRDYDKQLNISKFRLGRAFRLMPHLIPLGILNLSISILPWILILFLIPSQYYTGTSLGIFTLVIVAVVIIKLLGVKFVSESLTFRVTDMILTVLTAPFLSILFSLHILTINPFYLRRGRAN
jgi:hypothetical protein